MGAIWLLGVTLLASIFVESDAYVPHQHRILCSRLKPITSLDHKGLEGPWLTVETLLLRNGVPQKHDDTRSKVCIRTFISDASESGLSLRSEIRLGAEKRKTGISKLEITDPLEPGRLTLMAKRPSTLNSDMLVIAARSSEFIVLAYCQPVPLSDEDEEIEDRPALWVKVLGRPSAYGGVAISSRDLHSLRNRIADILGLSELNSVRYDTSC
ncbi:uncharacterized protein LOC132205077 [Neocloeon triangulifer]|uniref:uncharacterized protein LOC132205077 n=1 Tax=Neocloeon triangulifer TaxID=2078957 RepID=UPI00286ECCEB|nr:uncharacterized protein LOC132205077 [Neocloeon triangulifer]